MEEETTRDIPRRRDEAKSSFKVERIRIRGIDQGRLEVVEGMRTPAKVIVVRSRRVFGFYGKASRREPIVLRCGYSLEFSTGGILCHETNTLH
jgi:hypothetical protein